MTILCHNNTNAVNITLSEDTGQLFIYGYAQHISLKAKLYVSHTGCVGLINPCWIPNIFPTEKLRQLVSGAELQAKPMSHSFSSRGIPCFHDYNFYTHVTSLKSISLYSQVSSVKNRNVIHRVLVKLQKPVCLHFTSAPLYLLSHFSCPIVYSPDNYLMVEPNAAEMYIKASQNSFPTSYIPKQITLIQTDSLASWWGVVFHVTKESGDMFSKTGFYYGKWKLSISDHALLAEKTHENRSLWEIYQWRENETVCLGMYVCTLTIIKPSYHNSQGTILTLSINHKPMSGLCRPESQFLTYEPRQGDIVVPNNAGNYTYQITPHRQQEEDLLQCCKFQLKLAYDKSCKKPHLNDQLSIHSSVTSILSHTDLLGKVKFEASKPMFFKQTLNMEHTWPRIESTDTLYTNILYLPDQAIQPSSLVISVSRKLAENKNNFNYDNCTLHLTYIQTRIPSPDYTTDLKVVSSKTPPCHTNMEFLNEGIIHGEIHVCSGKSHYWFVPGSEKQLHTGLSWMQAKSLCGSKGFQLLSVHTEEEMQRLLLISFALISYKQSRGITFSSLIFLSLNSRGLVSQYS